MDRIQRPLRQDYETSTYLPGLLGGAQVSETRLTQDEFCILRRFFNDQGADLPVRRVRPQLIGRNTQGVELFLRKRTPMRISEVEGAHDVMHDNLPIAGSVHRAWLLRKNENRPRRNAPLFYERERCVGGHPARQLPSGPGWPQCPPRGVEPPPKDATKTLQPSQFCNCRTADVNFLTKLNETERCCACAIETHASSVLNCFRILCAVCRPYRHDWILDRPLRVCRGCAGSPLIVIALLLSAATNSFAV